MSVVKTSSGRWRAKPKAGRVNLGSRTFDRKADAEAWHDAQVRSLDLGEYVDPRAGRETVANAWERWQGTRRNSKSENTHNTDRAALKALPASLKSRPVSSVQASAFESLYDELQGTMAKESVRRYRTSYGAFFSWAMRERLCRSNPALAVQVQGVAKVKREEDMYPFDPAELVEVYRAMAADVGERGADLFLLLGLTGLRPGEAFALRVRDVQRVPRPALFVSRSKSDGVSVRNSTKRGRDRTVPLVPEAWAIVEPLTKGRAPEELLFSTRTGGFLSLSSWRRDVHWSTHARGRTPKDLRHSFATNSLSAGVDVRVVQRWLGHATATLTIDLYGRWIRDAAEDLALDRLAAAFTASGGVRGAERES